MKVLQTAGPDWVFQDDYDGYIVFPKISAAVFLSARTLLKMRVLGRSIWQTKVSRLREHLG